MNNTAPLASSGSASIHPNPGGEDRGDLMRFSHQESVPVEGRDRRRWSSLQRVVRDFERGPSEQAPAKRHSVLGRLTALTCRVASLARPWTANPDEKTSMSQPCTVHSMAATATTVVDIISAS